ncbi:MAG: methyltransferase domain-containing protein, partial [Spongiibacteraceae bacterium]|nr:methyltransferase domain-containing protein [Spongiibacteraceae bacterium]
LGDWFDTPLGRQVVATERELLGRELERSLGYHLLQLGVCTVDGLLADARVQHCMQGTAAVDLGCRSGLVCEAEQLPFAADSLDVVVVHHRHEYCRNPHQLLREVARVVVPRGRILLLGFNPWSVLGARQLAGRAWGNPLWSHHVLSTLRLSDWLQLLGFGIDSVQFGYLNGRAGTSRWQHWPFGGVYLLAATREVVPLTPARRLVPVPRPAFPDLSVVKPTASLPPHNHNRKKT